MNSVEDSDGMSPAELTARAAADREEARRNRFEDEFPAWELVEHDDGSLSVRDKEVRELGVLEQANKAPSTPCWADIGAAPNGQRVIVPTAGASSWNRRLRNWMRSGPSSWRY